MSRLCASGEGIELLWIAVERIGPVGRRDVRLWRCALPALTAEHLDHAVRLGWLTTCERTAADRRPTPELRSRFGARRVLRRLVAAVDLGTSPDEIRVDAACPQCGGSGHGQPLVVAPAGASTRMSTSSADDRYVIALGDHSVGVDIESRHREPDTPAARLSRTVQGWDRVAERCPPGSSPIEVWTALEALSKAIGRGLLATEQEIGEAAERHHLTWLADEPGLVTCVATSTLGRPTVGVVELRLPTALT